ncbi:ER membrane protein complex subunit 7 [Zea mays]|uniref:ER membrane protein complex subunit 7 n=2 Tax=Zea mays TaxID=4577 RepID=A0A3L6DDF7_MAIZE|nr:hypothetical protein Zm00014a_001835 [Zea mays]PWZ06615.1 ER membrane protein complex subunit 7 [Zea mays]
MRINRTEVQPSVTSQTEKGRDEPTSSTAPFRPSATVTSNDDHGDDGRFLPLPRALAPVSPRVRHIGLPRYRGSASSRVGLERVTRSPAASRSMVSMSEKGYGLPAKTSNTKVILNGGQRVTFARPDGYFALYPTNDSLPHNVPAGTHLIEVSSIGYFFSPVRVDISARNPGYIQAALTETRRVLNELVLEPLKEEQYYEVREPFSIMSLLKSPMGLMVGFMVLMVFVMPKMMENLDPEEMKQAQEQMRNNPVSFSGLLARAQG